MTSMPVLKPLFAVGTLIVSSGALAAETKILYSTPPQITLVEEGTKDKVLWLRLGDAQGRPLYTYDVEAQTGKPLCVDECTKEFAPYVASKSALAYGDWTIAVRADGSRQWAYQGLPLYTYLGDFSAVKGAAAKEQSQRRGAPNMLLDPGSPAYSPKEGWRRAAFSGGSKLPTPAGLEVQNVSSANGSAILNFQNGRLTYILTGAPKNPRKWIPVLAPALGIPVGEFTIVEREDGQSQWAFRGELLFNYADDYSRTDQNGLVAEKVARLALVQRHFMPPDITIQSVKGRGPLMTTRSGLSVYTQHRYVVQYGGRETRDGYRFTYADAKAVGTRGCTGKCTRTWRPVLAPASAQSQGFWEIMRRDDGSRQWAYKGSPLYTYSDDRKLGDIAGNDKIVPVFGDPEGKVDLSVTGGDDPTGPYRSGSAFYWHIASLFD